MKRIFRIHYRQKGVIGYVKHGWFGKFSTEDEANKELQDGLSGEILILDDKHGRINPEKYEFSIQEFNI